MTFKEDCGIPKYKSSRDLNMRVGHFEHSGPGFQNSVTPTVDKLNNWDKQEELPFTQRIHQFQPPNVTSESDQKASKAQTTTVLCSVSWTDPDIKCTVKSYIGLKMFLWQRQLSMLRVVKHALELILCMSFKLGNCLKATFLFLSSWNSLLCPST